FIASCRTVSVPPRWSTSATSGAPSSLPDSAIVRRAAAASCSVPPSSFFRATRSRGGAAFALVFALAFALAVAPAAASARAEETANAEQKIESLSRRVIVSPTIFFLDVLCARLSWQEAPERHHVPSERAARVSPDPARIGGRLFPERSAPL